MSAPRSKHWNLEEQPQCLPLREAMLRWSDPALIDAVREAETAFTPEELDRLDGDEVERLVMRSRNLSGGHAPVTNAQVARTAALYRAWDAVVDGFREMAARQEVFLEGVWVNPRVLSKRARLPAAMISKAAFGVRGTTVRVDSHVYEEVTASLAPPDPLDEVRAKVAGADTVSLPLHEALVAWPELSLVRRVRRLERYLADVQGRALQHPRLFDRPASPVEWDDLPWSDRRDSDKALAEAWHALLLDFRRKIECGDLQVSGVQSWPVRQRTREPLPAAWAADFRFDVEAGQIDVVAFNMVDRSFVGVNVSTAAPSIGLQNADAKGPADERSDVAASDATPARRTGRPQFPVGIFIEIARTRTRAKSNKLEAGALLTAMAELYPHEKRPGYRTVIDHVEDIYRKVARSKTA